MTTHVVFRTLPAGRRLSIPGQSVQSPSFEKDRDRDTQPDSWSLHAFLVHGRGLTGMTPCRGAENRTPQEKPVATKIRTEASIR